MIFAFSEEQEQLRATVRRFLADKSPESEVRPLMETVPGYDPEVWRQAAGQLGLAGLTIPEKFGGSGYGYVELTVVFEEMGRALLCAPFFATVALAANLLLSTDDEIAKADYLPGLACGDVIATVALAEPSGRWDEALAYRSRRPRRPGGGVMGERPNMTLRMLTRGRSAVLPQIVANIGGTFKLIKTLWPHIGTDPSIWTNHKTLTLFVKPFMDESDIDMSRIERCCFHNASPRGVMSFCALNAHMRPAQPHAQESAFVPLPTRRTRQQAVPVE